MALKDQIFVGGVWVDSAVRITNDSGTVLVSGTDQGNGEAISDEYNLTLSAVSGGTGTITVGTLSPNNPYKGRVRTGVALDGTTIRRDVVPGVGLVFSASGVNTNTATVKVGVYLGTFDAFGVGAGVPSAGTRHKVVNDGSGAVSDAKVRLLVQAVLVKKTGNALAYVRPFAEGATEKQAGGGSTRTMPYAISVINVSGSGVNKIGDLQVDGATLGAGTILDLQTGTLVSGTGLKAVSPSYAYRITSGPLTGTEFALDAAVGSGDTANVLIFPSRYVQIAPDVSGSAGTYGTVDVTLTQSGQSAGVIQPSGEAFYWVRVLVPSGAGSESNPHPTNPALQGTETGAAGWLV